MIAGGRLARGSVGLNCVMLDDDCGEGRVLETHWIAGGDSSHILKFKVADNGSFVDDITGQPLDPILCRAARKKEMDYVKSKGLWAKRAVKECWERTRGPPVTVRWVEVNKGDDQNPNIRSRLVARQNPRPGTRCSICAHAAA